MIYFVDLSNGKQLDTKIQHSTDILEICVNQHGLPTQRKIIFIDKNHDLYISPIHKPKLIKLASMVQSAMWNDRTDMLAAIIDGNFTVWLYPAAVFFDKDLIALTKTGKDAK